ncbi:C-C motif chemokine 1 [Cricetulus griseus]|nr:C-C motif chemokine 1 [Cricetulus griseus]
MKVITTALMCLLLAAMWPQDVDSKSMHVPSSRCCFRFLKKMPPQKLIQCYREISSSCSHPAVVFRLKKGLESCALTTTTWVQDYLKKVKPC